MGSNCYMMLRLTDINWPLALCVEIHRPLMSTLNWELRNELPKSKRHHCDFLTALLIPQNKRRGFISFHCSKTLIFGFLFESKLLWKWSQGLNKHFQEGNHHSFKSLKAIEILFWVKVLNLTFFYHLRYFLARQKQMAIVFHRLTTLFMRASSKSS